MFIKNPSEVFLAMLRSIGSVGKRDEDFYDYGRLSLALEIVTQIKQLESLPVVSDLGRQEAVSALHTLLVELQMDDLAYEWYEKLGEWRTPKFVPVVADALVPEGTAVFVGPLSGDPDGPVSVLGVLENVPLPDGMNLDKPSERRMIGPGERED